MGIEREAELIAEVIKHKGYATLLERKVTEQEARITQLEGALREILDYRDTTLVGDDHVICLDDLFDKARPLLTPEGGCVCGHQKGRHQLTNLGNVTHCADCGCQLYSPEGGKGE